MHQGARDPALEANSTLDRDQADAFALGVDNRAMRNAPIGLVQVPEMPLGTLVAKRAVQH